MENKTIGYPIIILGLLLIIGGIINIATILITNTQYMETTIGGIMGSGFIALIGYYITKYGYNKIKPIPENHIQ